MQTARRRLALVGHVLSNQPGRQEEAEAAYRAAITAGNAKAWLNLGNLLVKQPGRGGEAEAAYRKAIDAGHTDSWFTLGYVLSAQPGREDETEAAYRAAIGAGNAKAWLSLGSLLGGQPGREGEAEAAYRKAVDAGYVYGWLGVCDVLSAQPGREDQAQVAYRKAHAVRAVAERMRRVLGRMAVLTFIVNLVFSNIREAGAWTTVHDVNAVTFWVALAAFLVARIIEIRQRRNLAGQRRVSEASPGSMRRSGTRRPPSTSDPASPARAGYRTIAARWRRLELELERRFPKLYDARHAARGLGRVLGPLLGPLLMALLVLPVLALLGGLIAPLGLKAPSIGLPSVELPRITPPGWLRAIGDAIGTALSVLAPVTMYMVPVVVLILGVRRTREARRERAAADQAGRAELLQRLTVVLCTVEAAALAEGATTVRDACRNGP